MNLISGFSFFFLIQLQANCAVCKADDSGAMCLSSSPSCRDLFGTHSIGMHGKIRSWKSVSHIFSFHIYHSCSHIFVGVDEFFGIIYMILHLLFVTSNNYSLIFEGSSPSDVGEANGLRLVS